MASNFPKQLELHKTTYGVAIKPIGVWMGETSERPLQETQAYAKRLQACWEALADIDDPEAWVERAKELICKVCPEDNLLMCWTCEKPEQPAQERRECHCPIYSTVNDCHENIAAGCALQPETCGHSRRIWELNPCHICGNKPLIECADGLWSVQCEGCGNKPTRPFEFECEAVQEWNENN